MFETRLSNLDSDACALLIILIKDVDVPLPLVIPRHVVPGMMSTIREKQAMMKRRTV